MNSHSLTGPMAAWSWPVPGSATGGSGTTPSTHPAAPTQGYPSLGAAGAVGTVPSASSATAMASIYSAITSLNGSMSLSLPQPKTTVKFVIVSPGGQCLELNEHTTITPREMIGICKFVTMVASVGTGAAPVTVSWLDLINNLGITNHFDLGQGDHTIYDSRDDECAYIKLFCSR